MAYTFKYLILFIKLDFLLENSKRTGLEAGDRGRACSRHLCKMVRKELKNPGKYYHYVEKYAKEANLTPVAGMFEGHWRDRKGFYLILIGSPKQ